MNQTQSRIHTIPQPSDDDPEEWRQLPEDLKLSKYQVSSLGRIKNIKGHILSDKPKKSGYVCYKLYLDGKTLKNLAVHVLVAKTFIPNELNKDSVNHINTVKNDNRVINLEWATHAEQKYKENNKPITAIGKSIIQYDLEGNFIKRWEKLVDAEKELGINHRSICSAASGRTKTSGGFIWKYCDEEKKDLENEIWKQLSEDEYDNTFVSNLGRIKSKGNNPFFGTLMDNGYYRTNLFNKKEGKYRGKLVHRLICKAFAPNPENKPIVNHKDENRTNNNIENLEWVTQQENTNHSLDLHARVASNCRSRIVLQIQDGKIIKEFPSIRQAALKTEIPGTTISYRCRQKSPQSGIAWIFKTDFIE